MAVEDKSERDLARLPQRLRPITTRTDGQALQREATAVTRPLFTADESADEADSDEGDLFDGGAAPGSDATEFSLTLPQHTAVANDADDSDSDDDSADDSAESGAVERTVVSLVLPDHLRDNSDDDDAFVDGAPTQFNLEAHESAADERPLRRREPTQSQYVYATKPPAARPAWQIVAIAVAAVVLVAVVVIAAVAAFAVTPSPAP
jgi:hypothetical protein